MSAAPDLLLKSAPVNNSRVDSARASSRAAEAPASKGSSFADVYAQERQDQSRIAQENASKAAQQEKNQAPKKSATTDDAAASGSQSPAVADSGNALPGDDTVAATDDETVTATDASSGEDAGTDDTTADATLLTENAGLLATPENLAAQAQLGSSSFKSSGPASMTAASFDPELDALNQLPAVKMALELGAKAKAAAAAATATGSAEATGKMVSPDGGFASAMAAMSQDLNAGVEEGGELGDIKLGDLSVDQLKSLEQGATDSRPENFVSKLNALTQAMNQQQGVAKPVLVPGQPIAMQQGGWSEAVVDRVMWLSSQNLKSAEIQLDPAELGRLDVRIHMSADQTQVSFASANPVVRDALEGQMHRLREMFNQQGMGLMDASVSDQSSGRGWQGQGSDDGAGTGSNRGSLAGSDELEPLSVAVESRQMTGASLRSMVDYYA
ncbi:hypothetical protein AX279_20145 [Pseudomonas sp. J237]|nr:MULTISPECIES: flagellar hook-length control protein FliK [Pseudomonas]OEO24137.1 hypothetical protein AX279_20145 [Pseudomonas sp. J237]